MKLRDLGRFAIAASFVVLGGALAKDVGFATTLRLSAAPGVDVPRIDQLARKIDAFAHELPGIRTVVSPDGKRVEVQRLGPAHSRSALVRSYDAATGRAYVDVQDHPHYRMPVFQMWRFDGSAWSDNIDPGIFVGGRRGLR